MSSTSSVEMNEEGQQQQHVPPQQPVNESYEGLKTQNSSLSVESDDSSHNISLIDNEQQQPSPSPSPSPSPLPSPPLEDEDVLSSDNDKDNGIVNNNAGDDNDDPFANLGPAATMDNNVNDNQQPDQSSLSSLPSIDNTNEDPPIDNTNNMDEVPSSSSSSLSDANNANITEEDEKISSETIMDSNDTFNDSNITPLVENTSLLEVNDVNMEFLPATSTNDDVIEADEQQQQLQHQSDDNEESNDNDDVDKSLLISAINHDYDDMLADSSNNSSMLNDANNTQDLGSQQDDEDNKESGLIPSIAAATATTSAINSDSVDSNNLQQQEDNDDLFGAFNDATPPIDDDQDISNDSNMDSNQDETSDNDNKDAIAAAATTPSDGNIQDISIETNLDNNDQDETNEDDSNNDVIAAAAIYTAATAAATTPSNESLQQPSTNNEDINDNKEEVMDAIPLLAATAAMQTETSNDPEEVNQDNFHTIDINENNNQDNRIKTFDHYEKSLRDMGLNDTDDENDNQEHGLLAKTGTDDTNYQSSMTSDVSKFEDEGRILVNDGSDDDNNMDKNDDKSKAAAAGCWFNIISFIILITISGIIIAVVLIFIPGNNTDEEPELPIEIPINNNVPKLIIDGSCIKGNSMSMSSDGNKIIYINSDYDSQPSNNNNDMILNTFILLHDVNSNQSKNITAMNNIASAFMEHIPITISPDGNTLAYVSSSTINTTTIQVFQIDNDSKYDDWIPVGSITQLCHSCQALLPDTFSLSLSNYGSYIAIGNSKDAENGFKSGKATLYAYSNNDKQWEPIQTDSGRSNGNEIIGEAAGDMTGMSVSVSYNNNTLVFVTGSPGDKDIGSIISNTFNIKADNNKITYVNQTTQYGIGENSLFGSSISLSDDGRRIAVGSSYYNFDENENNGKCDVYEYNQEKQSWMTLGDSIIGDDNNYYLGYNVALSGDGSRVAISSKNPYIVQVYEYTSDNWGMIGTNFTYPENNDTNSTTTTSSDDSILFGSSISLNYDGSILAISSVGGGGSSGEEITNSVNTAMKCGKVFIYDVGNPNSDTS